MMKLLEVIKADDTTEEVFEAMLAWGQGMFEIAIEW